MLAEGGSDTLDCVFVKNGQLFGEFAEVTDFSQEIWVRSAGGIGTVDPLQAKAVKIERPQLLPQPEAKGYKSGEQEADD
jgi:hypothetical protein